MRLRIKLPRGKRQIRTALLYATLLFAGSVVFDCNSQTVATHDLSGNLRSLGAATNAAPIILAQPLPQLGALSASVAFGVSAVGSPPLTYQWQVNSNNIPGATNDALLLTNLGSADFGAYRVIVGNASGSVTSSNALLQLDSDHDGMADAWEIAHFGSITNSNGFLDYDTDGVSDRNEFLEGTDPKSFNSANPRLTIYSDRGEVFVTPNVATYTNGQTITLTGVPDPGLQFLGYLGQATEGGSFYNIRTNPATMKLGAIGLSGSQTIRAIFGLPLPEALNVTNGWRIDQAGWFGETNVTHDGVSAAQSARIFNGEEAILQLTNVILSSEGTIHFWWKVDGTDLDVLQFRRNNHIAPGAIGTNTDWQLRTYYLAAGTNVIQWEYVKGGNQVSEYNGLFYAPADAGWVDEVSYAPWPDPLLDSDGDGLPDIWEYKYFDTLAYGADDDPDGDGISNRDEYLDGTDPNNRFSLLPRLTVITSGGTIVRQPDLPKYTYGQTVQLQAAPDVTNYFVIWGGALSGTNVTNSITMLGNKTISAVFGLPLDYALNTTSLAWTRNSPLGFFGQTNFSHDGVCAAQAGPVGFHEGSGMSTAVNGPGTLVFWWKASSDTNQNIGRFLLDGVEQPGSISGQTDWQPESFYLNAGAHTLQWTYTNLSPIISLTNGIWVDQVAFVGGSIPPTIVAQPSDALAPAGNDVTFQVTATGTPPFTYQWLHNGTSLGAPTTNPSLTVSNVAVSQAGSYQVIVSNSVQAVSSRAATLTVLPVPPVNDNFANATPLVGTNAVLGYTFGATKEAGETNHDFIFGGHSVWWSWVAPSNGDYRVSVISTNIGTPLVAAIYTGTSVTALTGDGGVSGTVSTIGNDSVSTVSFLFTAVTGTTYDLAVDHDGYPDAFVLVSIDPSSRPVLNGSIDASGGSFTFDFSAPPGTSYLIEASNDLQTWTLVASGTVPANGTVSFTDSAIASSKGRFYRLTLQ